MDVFVPWPLTPRLRCIRIRNMILSAYVGVYLHEYRRKQRIRLNVALGVLDDDPSVIGQDDLSRTVSYENAVLMIQSIVKKGHVRLVETLAELIATGILSDKRVQVVRVAVEKLDVFAEIESVGVEIERWSGQKEGLASRSI